MLDSCPCASEPGLLGMVGACPWLEGDEAAVVEG